MAILMVLNFTCFELIFHVKILDFLRGNQFAIVLGNHPKTRRNTVFGVGLFVEGKHIFKNSLGLINGRLDKGKIV